MSLITTKNGRTVLKKAESMMFVPYAYDSAIGDYVLGSDVYDISAVIGDSTVVEQSDGDTTTKHNEFKASPLLEVVSGSKYAFTAQCLDLQNAVLKSLFGAMTVSGVEGAAAFNDDFVQIYALVRIRFADASLPDVILPKVQLNSKLFINQLKTRASQGNIAGTALALNCAIKNSANTALSQFSSQATGVVTYTPYTPVLFVPRGRAPLFFKAKKTDTIDYYSSINFTTGNVSEVLVAPRTGALPIPGGGGSGGGGGQGGGGNA